MTCTRCDSDDNELEEIYSFDMERVSFWQCRKCKEVVARSEK